MPLLLSLFTECERAHFMWKNLWQTLLDFFFSRCSTACRNELMEWVTGSTLCQQHENNRCSTHNRWNMWKWGVWWTGLGTWDFYWFFELFLNKFELFWIIFELFSNYFELFWIFCKFSRTTPYRISSGVAPIKIYSIFPHFLPPCIIQQTPPSPPYVYYKILTQMVKEMEGFLLTQESCIIIISTGL